MGSGGAAPEQAQKLAAVLAEPLSEDGAVRTVEAFVVATEFAARPAGGRQRRRQQGVDLEVAQYRS